MRVWLEVELERYEGGKFASKESVADEVVSLLDGQEVDVDGTVYQVTGVSVVDEPKRPRIKKPKPAAAAVAESERAGEQAAHDVVAASAPAIDDGEHEG